MLFLIIWIDDDDDGYVLIMLIIDEDDDDDGVKWNETNKFFLMIEKKTMKWNDDRLCGRMILDSFFWKIFLIFKMVKKEKKTADDDDNF